MRSPFVSNKKRIFFFFSRPRFVWVKNALFDLSLLFSGTIFIRGVDLVMAKNHSTVKSMSDVCRPIVFQPLLFCGMRYSIVFIFFIFYFVFIVYLFIFLSAKNGGNTGTLQHLPCPFWRGGGGIQINIFVWYTKRDPYNMLIGVLIASSLISYRLLVPPHPLLNDSLITPQRPYITFRTPRPIP